VAIGGISAALGAQAVINYANEWARLTRALEGSEQAFGISLASAERLVDLANDARVDVDAFAKTYVRAAAAVRDYGFSSRDAEAVTSTLAKSLKLGQASASEQASTILQFSQALQKGKLDGDEFRTVMENAGIVQELLAKRLNVSKGEIIEMAAAGKLSIKTLVTAMLEGQAMIDRLYREMPLTVDEAFTVLRNNVIEYLGNADKMNGATQALAGAIQGVASNLDLVAVAAGAILGSAALRMAAFAAAAAGASNPLTLLAAAVGGLTVAYQTMGRDMAISEDGVVRLGDAVDAFFDKMNGRTEIETLKLQLELLRGEERELALQQLELQERYAGFWGTLQLGADAIGVYARMVDTAAGGPIQHLIDQFGALGDTVARASGLMDDARRVALEYEAARTRSVGFGGDGFKEALQGRTRGERTFTPSKSGTDRRSQFEREVDQIKKRTAALQSEIATVGETTLAQERARAAAELRAAAASTAAKEGRAVTAQEIAAIDQLANAYASAQVQSQFLTKLQAESDRTRSLRDEISLIGLTGVELERARIEQELLNAAREAGIALTPAERERIAVLAAENAELTRVRDTMREVQETSADALKGFISDLREGKSAAESLGNALDRLATKLIDQGIDSLIGSAFGGGGSGGGGLLASLLGGGSPAGGGFTTTVIPAFARGGITGGPSLAGESGPEAIVPLPDGRRIPVDLRMPAMPAVASGGAPSVALSVNIDARGATPDAVQSMNSELVPTIQKVVRTELHEAFDRSSRFGRSGI